MNPTKRKSLGKINPVLAAALAFALAAPVLSGAAAAQHSIAVKEDAAQLQADKAALQRQVKRLEADEAMLRADTASGRMSAVSKDAHEADLARQAVAGERKDIAADKTSSRQMQSDKAALQRQIKRLETAEARLKADTAEGKMAAMSRDSEKVYKDRLAINGEKQDIKADRSQLTADESK